MSTRKYRLAVPIDDDNVAVPYQPPSSTAPRRLPRWAMSNDTEFSSRPMLLNNVKTVEKAPSNSHPRWWLVLPCLVFMILASASDPLLMNDLIVRRYERYYGLDASAGGQRAVCRESMSTTPAPIAPIMYWQYPPPNQNPLQSHPNYNLVQRDAARFNIKNSIATIIPALVTFILLGSNSDTIGRRPLLVLPFFSKVLRYSFLLIIVSLNLSDIWLIATQAVEAFFGPEGLVILSSFAYITDCTNESRTRAFFITEVVIVIARVIPVLALSLWLRHHLYTVPLSVNLGLSVTGFFYALLVQPESVEAV